MTLVKRLSDKQAERVVIFDTTLRDGEQSPGASMNLDEKLRLALALEEMGVDVIEAGFPIASNGDFEAVKRISEAVSESVICALARANPGDIERAAEALRPARRKRLHTFISTSPLHMKHKLRMGPEQVCDAIIASVTLARNFTDDVEWSPEDGSRSEHDFLCRCVETAIAHGASTINIPDTVGYALPQEFAALIQMLFDRVPNIDQAVISVHCHNDLGLAVANSLAAVAVGARQIECTINGIGERAGNAALEEVVMALKTRHDFIPHDTGIDTRKISRLSHMVSTITGFAVQPNKAIVGKNAFAHESGIHQDGMLKNADTYEIMTPESIGLSQSTIVLGKHSGRHAFGAKLRELGYALDEEALNDAFMRFKDLADRKKTIFEDDIFALVDDEIVRVNDRIRLVSLQVTCGSQGPSKIELELEIEGETRRVFTDGDGPVDGVFKAITNLFPHQGRLLLYQVNAVTEGADAQAEVTVRLEEDGKSVTGQGADVDTMVASARAYVNALNKLIVKRQRSLPSAVPPLVRDAI